MPGEAVKVKKSLGYRPPQAILDTFWTLSEGSDEQRGKSASELSYFIQNSKDEDKEQILKYCKDRLVRGLSSGRKFARVGFAVALTQLLRDHPEIKTDDITATIKDKLKVARYEKKSKAEVGGIYLGRAFAFSTLIRSGKVSEMDGEAVGQMTEELMTLSEKKSYLKAVCNKTLEDLVPQISIEIFGEYVWSKIRDKMKQGWEACTLDILSLLLTCRKNFPDIVNKKFLKKHWGFPILSEENDDKLLKSVLASAQKEALFESLVPFFVNDERDILSIWKGIGEKLCEHLSGKKADVMTQRQLVGLKLAIKLLSHAKEDEVKDMAVCPQLARCIFHSITKKNDPLAITADNLCQQLCARLEAKKSDIAVVVENIWKIDASLNESKSVILVNSSNITYLIDMMSEENTRKYVDFLLQLIKGDHSSLASLPEKQTKQKEVCLRQLQHIVCSAQLTNHSLQKNILSLLLRLAFFRVSTSVKSIEHCETTVSFDEQSPLKKLSESLLYKSLDSISTLNTGHQSKAEKSSNYLELLHHLASYMQTLMHNAKIKPLTPWPDGLQDEWQKLFHLISKMKNKDKQTDKDSAFLLLLMFLGLQMFVDFKTVSELLKDVIVCFERSSSGKKRKASQSSDEEEPEWVEVITEVLLNLLSLQSHFGRTVSAAVFRSLSAHLTPAAVSLITEVLIPKTTRGDDAGGVLVEVDGNDDEDDEDDEDDVSEEEDDSGPESDEKANDDDEGDDNEDDDDEDDDTVDEKFRQSVKEALGAAAYDKNESEKEDEEEDEELSDLSDTEMFKIDDMLAEVFRQRKKAGGKKAREEKRKETANFRLRVLDLVENMIKSERCGDFMLDLLKPLLLLMMKTSTNQDVTLCDRSRNLFNHLRSKAKGLQDNVHSPVEQKAFFEELLALARKVSDPIHLQPIATAVYLVMCLSSSSKDAEHRRLNEEYNRLISETIFNVVSRKQPKPHMSFFTNLVEINPAHFQSLSPKLLQKLRDEKTKVHSKTMCCSLLASLGKRTDIRDDSVLTQMKNWMNEAIDVVSQIFLNIEKTDIKSMFIKDVLTLTLALQKWTDVFPLTPLSEQVRVHLVEVKSKFNTDLKRLANKVIAAIERARAQQKNGGKKKEKKKKRKLSESQEVETQEVQTNNETQQKKKRKRTESESEHAEHSPKKKKLKKSK